MTMPIPGLRKPVSALLTGALLATSLLVPLLDRAGAASTPALETEHHASTCVVGHDHTICTQVGANLWIAPAGGSALASGPRVREATGTATIAVSTSGDRTSIRSRAPPAG